MHHWGNSQGGSYLSVSSGRAQSEATPLEAYSLSYCLPTQLSQAAQHNTSGSFTSVCLCYSPAFMTHKRRCQQPSLAGSIDCKWSNTSSVSQPSSELNMHGDLRPSRGTKTWSRPGSGFGLFVRGATCGRARQNDSRRLRGEACTATNGACHCR